MTRSRLGTTSGNEPRRRRLRIERPCAMMARERTLTGVCQSVEAGASPRTLSAAELDNDRLSAFRRLTLDSALAEILRRFDVHGVRSLLLKGAAFASWLYDDPRERPYGDVDLLIRPDQFDLAKGVLAELNFELSEPHTSTRFPWRPASSVLPTMSDGVARARCRWRWSSITRSASCRLRCPTQAPHLRSSGNG